MSRVTWVGVLCACLAVACAQTSSPTYDAQQCAGGHEAVSKSFRLSRMLAPPTDYVLISELGMEPTIRIYCVRITENPDGGSCSTRSLPRLCRDYINQPERCESLAEFTYTSNREIVRGEPNGPDVRWILLWDPRNKPASCYPRDVLIEVEYQLERPQGRSAVLAVIAIVGVSILVIAIGAFGLSRLLSKSKRQREAKKMAEQGTKEGRKSRYKETYDTVICPKCGHGQAKHWAGEDPLVEMRCRECGRTLPGWVSADTLLREQQNSGGFDPAQMPEGYTTMEIAARHDTAKRDAILVSKYASPNPLLNTFPPSGHPAPEPVVGQVVQRRAVDPDMIRVSHREGSDPIPFHNDADDDPVFAPAHAREYAS